MLKANEKYPIPNKINIVLSILFVSAIHYLLFIGGKNEVLDLKFLIICLLFGLFLIPVYSIIHEAEHNIALNDKKMNYYLGVMLSIVFGSSFTFIQKAHLNHHKNNRTDYELIDLYYDHRKRWFKKISFFMINIGFKWISILIATFVFALLPRVIINLLIQNKNDISELVNGTNSNSQRYIKIRIESVITICYHVGIIIFLNLNIVPYLLMYLFHAFIWSSQNYVSHAFSHRSVVHGAHNHKMNPLFRLFYLNFNLHLAHHENPSVPWLHLNKFVKPHNNISYFRAYMRLWKGPKLILPDDPIEYKQMVK
nr:fatty acid desaturase [uncultured Flavobacterium sp.]